MDERDRHLPRIVSVRPVGDLKVHLRFTDGTERTIDLEPYMKGPVFGSIRENPEVFRQVAVDDELGTIVWPNGADLDPDVLHAGGVPGWARKVAEGT